MYRRHLWRTKATILVLKTTATPLMRTIDWRRQICQFLNLGFESTDDTLLEALELASDKLEEYERLTEVQVDPRELVPRYQVIHRVRCAND